MKRISLTLAALCGSLMLSLPVFAEDAPAAPRDAELAHLVQDALNANAELQPFALQVSAKGSDVTIDGATDTGAQMVIAGQIAEKIGGVQFVFNNIMPRE